MKKGSIIHYGLAVILLVLLSTVVVYAAQQASQIPSPAVRDQITHDRGNIATTVDNYGYIGGYSFSGRPSGRWPANTEHDYLAEMRFWIGGINAAGDTLLVNTVDDFNPIPHLMSGSDTYDIRLSTDTATFEFNPDDTVGAGLGFPAEGWRVWDNVAEDWVYNQVYNIQDGLFYDGGPVSVQTSICRYGDDAIGFPVMGLEITQTIRQWNYSYNRDMIFFTLEIKNASTENYHDVALGIYNDYDVGGPDAITGENGRLGDLVACDTDLNLAWTYDEDGYDPGWGPSVVTGLMGTIVLSTPGDIGMTSFNTGQWEYLPTNDHDRYTMIDNTEFDTSLPPTDQYYVQAVRGIDLPAGATIQIDFALVAAPDEPNLLLTAQRAQALFENNYIGPKPPDPPNVTATAGDRAIKLYWDAAAEISVEPTTGEVDFKGYKIYRSSDRGTSWGTLVTNPDYSVGPDYYPVARVVEDVFGRLAHTFTDSNLVNGMEYWYSVVAYDTGAPDMAIDTLQNDRMTPTTAENTVAIIPRDDPLGYRPPYTTISQIYSGDWKSSTASVSILVVDEGQVTGDEYRVCFTEDCLETNWYLVNTSTGDTVLIAQDQLEGASGTFPVADGMQIIVRDADGYPDNAYQSTFALPGTETILPLFVEPLYPEDVCHHQFRNDIEIRFTAAGSVAYEWFTGAPVQVPYEVWNITADSQVGSWFADWSADGEYTLADEDYIILTNFDYDGGNPHFEVYPDYFTWIMAFDVESTPAIGDVFAVEGARYASADDAFDFSSRKLVAADATAGLDNIKAVPNPYLGYASWEDGKGISKMQFVNIPDMCTIRIYTLAGELVRTLSHDSGTGSQDWDMQSDAGRSVASGMYLYHVESQYGNFIGKFAVIN